MICANLTDIEQMLLDALRTGASNKEIPNRMSNSEQTVRNQLTKLFRKINVNNRTQAACWYHCAFAETLDTDIFLADLHSPVCLVSSSGFLLRCCRSNVAIWCSVFRTMN